MNMFVDKLTDKLNSRKLSMSHLHQQGLDDKALDGTTLLKPSRADLETHVQLAESNATQEHTARMAAEANATQFARKLSQAQSAQQAAEAKASQEAQEVAKAQSAQQAAETK